MILKAIKVLIPESHSVLCFSLLQAEGCWQLMELMMQQQHLFRSFALP